MSDDGIHLLEPYLGEGGALTGSARRNEEARARRLEVERRLEVARVQDQVTQRRRRALAQIEAFKADIDADEAELKRLVKAEEIYLDQSRDDAAAMARGRGMNTGNTKQD